MTPSYSVDTSSIIRLHRELPRDVFPTVWDNLERLIASGRAFLPRDCHEELKRKDDHLLTWAPNQSGFVVQPDSNEVGVATQITIAHPDWVQEQQNAGDPWAIANATVHSRVILTEEIMKGPGTIDKNLRIPNVASEFGVSWVNFNQLARDERWSF
jgi:hypothetical protein